MKKDCEPLLDAVARAAKSRKSKKSAVDVTLEILAKPPKVKNVDMQKCSALLIRDLQTYRARSIEVEALQTLKRIGVGLASVLAKDPPGVCPSAPPTPENLNALADGAVDTKPADWAADGWRCAGFAAAGPIRFQYELVTDVKAKKYELIARGYPGPDRQATELVFIIPFASGEADLAQPIYRR